MISVLIFTRNEEIDLPGCLNSVAWSDDIHVVDSGSTDATVRLGRELGANVEQSPTASNGQLFGGDESAHRNWALSTITFKYSWVLHIDADERVTPELAAASQAAVKKPGQVVAFSVQRRDFLNGTWLRHVQASPYYLRLFRPERMHYARLINPISIPDGPIGKLAGYLDHFPFSKGVAHWFNRHNGYSSSEAKQILANRKNGARFSLRKALAASSFNERRYHQKGLFYAIPFRPLAKFGLLYVIKGGFLDGRAGFTYAMLQSIYEYMIVLKVRELTDGEIEVDNLRRTTTQSAAIEAPDK